MRSRRLDNEKYLILFNKKYFIVNEFTRDLFVELDSTNDIKKISKQLNMPSFRVKKYYKTLQKKMNTCSFYDENIELSFPLKLQWRITKVCNLKCKHCYLGTLNNKRLSNERLLEITDRIIKSDIMEITLTGGECLTVDILPEIVYKLITNEIYTTIFTNGILIKSFIRKLENLGPYDKKYLNFNVSLDGTEKDHELIRGKNTYKKTIDAIKLLKKKNYYVLTNTVLTKINFKNIPKLYKILYKLDVDKIQLSNLIDSGRATKDLKLDSTDRKWLIENLKKSVNILDTGAKLLYAELPDEDNTTKIHLVENGGDNFIQNEDWKCSAGIGKATLDYDGNVYCCPFLKESIIGTILNESLKDIWGKKERLLFIKKLIKDNNNSRLCIAAKQRLK